MLEVFILNRTDSNEEVGNQNLYPPVLLPKLPGRIYFLFGKPIETRGIACFMLVQVHFIVSFYYMLLIFHALTWTKRNATGAK